MKGKVLVVGMLVAGLLAGCATTHQYGSLGDKEVHYRAARMLQDSGQAPATEAQCREEYGAGQAVEFDGRSHSALDVCLGVAEAYYSGDAEFVEAEAFPGERRFSNFLQTVMPQDPADQRVVMSALENYEIHHDRINDKFTLWPSSTTGYTKLSHAAIVLDADPEGAISSHLRLEYQGSTWLFAKAATIHVDGRNWEFSHLPFARYNGERKAYETARIPLEGKGLEAAEAIARGKDVLVRLHGDYGPYDMGVFGQEKEDIDRMLRALPLLN